MGREVVCIKTAICIAMITIHCVSKKDTGVAHYNFNACQPIW